MDNYYAKGTFLKQEHTGLLDEADRQHALRQAYPAFPLRSAHPSKKEVTTLLLRKVAYVGALVFLLSLLLTRTVIAMIEISGGGGGGSFLVR